MRREAGEDLPELLQQWDARTNIWVDNAARDVDGIGNELTRQRQTYRLRDGNPRLLLRLIGGCPQVGRHDDVVEPEQR